MILRRTVVARMLEIILPVFIFYIPLQAFASFGFFVRPMKVQTCDIMLSGALDPFASETNPLFSVREARMQIIEPFGAGLLQPGVAAYSSVSHLGAVKDLSQPVGEQIAGRLQGIEQALTSTCLDCQISVLEFRGDDVAKAFAALEKSEAASAEAFRRYKKASDSPLRRAEWLMDLDILAVFPMFASMVSEVGPELLYDPIAFGALAAATVSLPLMTYYHSYRLDWKYNAFKTRLSRFIKKPSSGEFLISSFNVIVPVNFQRYLMNPRSGWEEGRDEAFQMWRGSYFLKLFQGAFYLLEKEVRDQVTHAGDHFRHAYVDNIAYFDEHTREPVWLFVYRGYRNRPSSKNPKKTTEESSREESLDWLPGAKPVTFEAPAP